MNDYGNPQGEPRGLSEYLRVIPAGDVTEFNVRGNFIRVKELAEPLPITMRNSQLGAAGVAYTNVMKKFEKLFSAMEYDSVTVENTTDAAITVELQLGYGDYHAEVLSRTLAAPSALVTEVDMSCSLTDGQIPAPGNGGIVALVTRNDQRKRIKIAAYVYNLAQVAPSGTAIWFGVSDQEFDIEAPPPTYPFLREGSAGRVYVNDDAVAAWAIDEPLFLGEIELETTAPLYAIARATAPVSGGDITFQLKWEVIEELYSAS